MKQTIYIVKSIFQCFGMVSFIHTFLIVLGILALLGAGDAGDACAITLLLKVLPFLIIVGIVASLVFCGG